MNYLKSYTDSISGFVTGIIGDYPEVATDNTADSVTTENSNELGDAKPSDKGLLGWLPTLQSTGDNAAFYYMNTLASFGSELKTEKQDTDSGKVPEKAAVVEDVQAVISPSESSVSELGCPLKETCEPAGSDAAFMNWIGGLSSRTEKVWQQMKQDLSEVVSAMSVEPTDAVARTASSVRQRLSSVAEAARKIDASQFALLPETNTAEGLEGSKSDTEAHGPPEHSELPSFSNLRSDVSNFMQGVFSTLFGSDDSSAAPVKDRREARLHVLRADPATYELVPPLPPAHLGVLSYADWRAAYFDEVTCQPMPGIPLSGARSVDNEGQDVDKLLQAPQPSPEELLEQNQFMRTYLSQLVRVEGQADNRGISDGDFWSRYYYRVWLLDVTEQRRRRLAERVSHKAGSESSAADTTGGNLSSSALQSGITANVENTDWFGASDTETVDQAPCSSPCDEMEHSEITPTPSISPDGIDVPVPCDKAAKQGKPRRRRGKKRSEGEELFPPVDKLEPHPDSAKMLIPTELTPTVTIRQEDTCSNNNGARSVVESDEQIASGSSSLVVISHNDDDPEEKTAICLADASDENLDDWGEVCEDEFTSVPPAGDPKLTVRPEEEEDDWANWS